MTEQQERYVGIGAAVIVVIGAFLPWVKLDSVFGSMSRNGIDDGGDGLITAAAAVVGGLAMWQAGKLLWVALLASVAIIGVGLWDMNDASNRVSQVNADAEGLANASIGAGLYVTVAGGIVLGAVAAHVLSRRDSEQPDATTPEVIPDAPMPPQP